MIVFVISPKQIVAGVGFLFLIGLICGIGWHILRAAEMFGLLP